MTDRSQVDIRIVEPEEYITLGVNHYAFGKTPSKLDLEKARERLKYFGNTIGLGVFDGGKVQATCSVHVMTENVRGTILPMGGIGGVASLPAGRRQGHVRNMMVRAFDLMHEMNQPIATLYPFRDSFYERLGYAELAKNRFTTIKPEHLASLLRTPLPGTVEQLGSEACFDEWWAFAERLQTMTHGFALVEREKATEWRDNNESWVALVREDGQLTGAMTFTITGYTETLLADTFYATTAAARYQLLAWIGRHVDQVSEAVIELGPAEYPELWYRDLVAQSSTVHKEAWPAPMGRVIAVAGLDGIAAGADAEIAFRLVDDHCPWNNGIWTLTGENGVLSVREGGDPACHLTIQGLSALVWSGIDPATYPFRGWGDPDPAAQTTLQSLFPTAFPVLNEKF